MSPKPAKVRILKYSRLLSILLITVLLLGSQPVQTAQAATITVDTLVDENDHSCSNGDCSLRDAIETAVAGDTIDFSVTGTITLILGQLTIDKNLTISGPGAGSLSISGNDASRIFSVGSSVTVTIQGLTITKGLATDGAGIYVSVDTVTYINNSIISDNQSSDRGGGIYINGGFSILTDATMYINNSTISGNYAVLYGGGIRNYQGTLTLNNSTVSGNSTGVDDGYYIESGGGIDNYMGTLTLNNSTVSGNSSNFGGGFHARDGTNTLKNTTITNNTAHISKIPLSLVTAQFLV